MQNIYNGYSNEDLERKASRIGINLGTAPWLYWTAELYSVGKIYRKISWYPKFLPLYIYSDHGVHRSPSLAKHECDNGSNIHFVFNPTRENTPKGCAKKVYLVTHPWVSYRKKLQYSPSQNSKGTLVFLSHSTSSTEYHEENQEKYFADLKQLPERYKPLVICMHMHDINKGYHKKYRKYNIPIITFGNTSSVNYVDEFYLTTTKFKYATSNTPGSQLYFCIEMGMPYFLFGDVPTLINHSDPNFPLGTYNPSSNSEQEIINIEHTLFMHKNDRITVEQRIFVEWMLGLTSNKTRYSITYLIWYEFFRNFNRFMKLYIKNFSERHFD